MTKAELIAKISSQTGVEIPAVSAVVEAFMANVKDCMCEDESLFLRGFGTFKTKYRAPKTGRNITKNTTIDIPERYIPFFKPAKEFVKSVSENVKK